MSRRPQNPRFPPPIWPRRVVAPRDGGGGAGEAVRFLKVTSGLWPPANSPSSPHFQAPAAQKRAVAPTEQSLHGFRSRPRPEQSQFEVPKRDSGIPIPCRTERSLRAGPFRHPTRPHFAAPRPKFRPRKFGPRLALRRGLRNKMAAGGESDTEEAKTRPPRPLTVAPAIRNDHKFCV